MAGYIQIGDIKGQSVDTNHKDWINLVSVSHSIQRPLAPGKSGNQRMRASVNMADVNCVKEVDASSPKLQEAIAKGTVYPTVKIDLCTSAGGDNRTPYLQWELKNVVISSYSVSGATEGENIPTESFALNFEEIKVVYDKQGKDGKSQGKIDYSWKVEEGSK